MLAQLLLVAGAIALMDLGCYFLLPARIVRVFPPYRFDQSAALEDIAYRRANPARQPYYVAHPERGFDIGPGRQARFTTETEHYAISSNEFGCFDKPWNHATRSYIYLAGDSYTWGHAPLEKTFGYLFQAATSIVTAKCGVGHTGQLHQFSKFIDVTSRIGHLPDRVVVGYYVNDFANDNAHPHATVVDGLLVDTVVLDEHDRPVRLSEAQVRDSARRAKQSSEEQDSRTVSQSDLIRFLRRYSISANVANGIMARMKGHDRQGAPARAGRSIYDRTELSCVPSVYPFGQSAIYERHTAALRRWAEHAASSGYKLTFLLIPPGDCHADTTFYSRLREFLSDLRVEFIDLTFEFKARGLREEDLYRMQDRHLTFLGHRVVAEVLAARLRP